MRWLVLATLVSGAAAPQSEAQPSAEPGPHSPTPADDDPARIKDAAAHYPVLVTARTRADAGTLAQLQTPGKVIYSDGFDSSESLGHYFEIGGQKEGHAAIDADRAHVHSGAGSLRLTAVASGGRSAGAGPHLWLGDAGFDRVHLRYYIRYAEDYDQGNLNHTGGTLSGVAGKNKWEGMGGAGLRPTGQNNFSTRLEGWRDWQRVAAPGYMFLYTYWMDMAKDKDGHYWGNMLGPEPAERFVPERGRWYCIEEMVKVNAPGKADGELAAWIDGKLYIHYTGFRWRTTDALKIKRAGLLVYVHESRKNNTVWFDDVVVSTGYVGMMAVSQESGPK